ncbi:glycosyltransferase [Paenibacillus sp. RC21]|uniref:glycosyltransferase n=1 Tax=Paenibacillus sp. RC21 TaxID=3156312 RepID=UPI00383337CD
MRNDIKVSVIVPVYNVEKYLRKCLESLVSQTLESIEIIVVNDGSTDQSSGIIKEFEVAYPGKIVSLTKPNGGLGDTRNYGLKFAKGEYIGFVDSDDWVDRKMFEAMYGMTQQGHDIVLCDFMVVQDGWETGHVAKGFRGVHFNPQEIVINSIDPATACNKLYHRKFFQIAEFTDGWYEDIGTTPILLSYAHSVGYLELALYNYRQRSGSITYSADERTKDVISSWQRVLDNAHANYRREAVFAVYKSIVTFIEFKPAFADDFLEYAYQNQELFQKNEYYQKSIRSKSINDLFQMKLIPKKLHYFWFGHGQKSELIERCIESWKKHAGGYEIVEWNESNCDINESQFVKEAYEAKKWAFVADYFRIKVIHEQGGFYMDTDVELKAPLDSLRISNFFFAFETKDNINAAIFGGIPGFELARKWLETYQHDTFKKEDGTYNMSNNIVIRLTGLLKKDYNIKLNGKMQTLKDNVKIYPANKLTIDVYDGKNLAVHHFDASWWDVKDEVSYKNVVLQDYFRNEASIFASSDIQSELQKYQKLINAYENTLSWKITYPLRKIRALIRKIKK